MKDKDPNPQEYSGLNRREFLAWQIKGLALATATLSGAYLPTKVFAATPDLAVVSGDNAAATREAIRLLGGISKFVAPGARVVIKPNMSFTSPPERASNTHPDVIRELVALCKEAGAGRIRVLDNPLGPAEECIEGVKQVCKPFGSDMVHGLANRRMFAPTDIGEAVTLGKTDVMEDVLKSDVLIAVPVAKSHSSTGVSLSMKGMMGLIYDRGTMHRDHDLDDAIVDLASLLKPDLVVVDATRVLSSNGPGGPGKVLHPRTIIASRDMVAADAFTVERFPWYGSHLKAGNVKHIRRAHQRGLGRMDVDNLNVFEANV
jgi:uncharacterized protein (DUF362 family)